MATIQMDTSYLRDRRTFDATGVAIPLIDIKNGIEGWLAGTYEMKFVDIATANNTQVPVSGTITCGTRSVLRLYPYPGTSGSLTTINPATTWDEVPDVLFIYRPSSAHTLTIRHGVGNIYFNDEADVVLSGSFGECVTLYADRANSRWKSANKHHGSLRHDDFKSHAINLDEITLESPYVDLTPESGSTDDLKLINNPRGFPFIFLKVASHGNTVTLKHNADGGNIRLLTGDYALDTATEVVPLAYNDVYGYWVSVHGKPALANNPTVKTPHGTTEESSFTVMRGNRLKLHVADTSPARDGRFTWALPRISTRQYVYDQALGGSFFSDDGSTSFTTVGTVSSLPEAAQNTNRIVAASVDGSFASRSIPAADAYFSLARNPYFEVVVGVPSIKGGLITFSYGGYCHFGLLGTNVPNKSTYTSGVTGIFFMVSTYNTNSKYLNIAVYEDGVNLHYVQLEYFSSQAISTRLLRFSFDYLTNTVRYGMDDKLTSSFTIEPTGPLLTTPLRPYVGGYSVVGSYTEIADIKIGHIYADQEA